MKNTQAKQTAAACYAERHAECHDLLKRIAKRLDEHKRQQAAEPVSNSRSAWFGVATSGILLSPVWTWFGTARQEALRLP